MIFHTSEQHKLTTKRKALLAAIVVAGVTACSAWAFFASDSLHRKILSAVVFLLFTKYLFNTYRNIKNHDHFYPTVTIIEPENKIDIAHKGAVLSIPLSDIEHLRIQTAKGKIKSLLLNTKSFSDLRFEGYDDLAEMAEILKRHTPVGKIKTATWFHR